jgi:hypothetical protein
MDKNSYLKPTKEWLESIFGRIELIDWTYDTFNYVIDENFEKWKNTKGILKVYVFYRNKRSDIIIGGSHGCPIIKMKIICKNKRYHLGDATKNN